MIRKELLLSIAILLALGATAFTLRNGNCYDCTQPTFSQSSSCSAIGGSCVSTKTKISFNKLIDQLVHTGKEVKTIEKKGCAPNTQIQDIAIDSVSHIH